MTERAFESEGAIVAWLNDKVYRFLWCGTSLIFTFELTISQCTDDKTTCWVLTHHK